MNMEYKRGDIIWIAGKKEVLGSEQQGNRPAVVIQNDMGNRYSPNLIVAEITKVQKRKWMPTHVNTSVLEVPSVIMCEMINTVSKKRVMLNKGVRHVTKEEEIKLNEALKASIAI